LKYSAKIPFLSESQRNECLAAPPVASPKKDTIGDREAPDKALSHVPFHSGLRCPLPAIPGMVGIFVMFKDLVEDGVRDFGLDTQISDKLAPK
jgi:hypothetical protein